MFRRQRQADCTPGRLLLGLGVCVVIAVILAGCGGDDEYYYPPYDEFPHYKRLTILLNVSDASARALGGVTVWVDGIAQAELTSWDYVTLGNGYPIDWQGFQTNWVKAGFTVALYDYNDRVKVEVVVSKAGYYSQSTSFWIDDSLTNDVRARETFVMEPNLGPASAGVKKPRPKAQPGEVISFGKGASSAHVDKAMYQLSAATEAVLVRREPLVIG
ncbi:hypothetical protein LLH03_21460 [bacterium]|nr:hypothetical protein [bacterium]